MATLVKSRISLARSAAAASASLTLLYVLCWAGAYAGVPVTHLWIKGFTFAPVDSITALVEGTIWSIIAGAIVGATAAFFYNVFSGLDRR